MVLQVLADGAVQLPRAHDLLRVPLAQNFFHHQLNVVQVLLRLQRVINAVIARFIQLNIVHPWVIAIMFAAGGLNQSMRHQRSGGYHSVDQPFIDQVADDQTLLGHGHGACQGHDHEAVLVSRHGLKHVHRLAKLATGKCRVRHAAHQIADALGLGKVQRKNRRELVLHRIVELAVNACAFLLLAQRFTSEIERGGANLEK